MARCGIKHQIPEITCVLPEGHEGKCISKTSRFAGGSLGWTEWSSKNGKFHYHCGYKSFYPKNMKETCNG